MPRNRNPAGQGPSPVLRLRPDGPDRQVHAAGGNDPLSPLCRLGRLAANRDDLTLTEVDPEGASREAGTGILSMDREFLRVGKISLPVAGIRDMATLQNRKLAVSTEDHYYELQAPEALCLRKYLLLWRHLTGKDAEETAGNREA